MPKFLDVPQWYNSQGNLVKGLGEGATVKWAPIASSYGFSSGYSSYTSPSGNQLVLITDAYNAASVRNTHWGIANTTATVCIDEVSLSGQWFITPLKVEN